jgi:uncharacterized protein YndB with AHSA1/START domain
MPKFTEQKFVYTTYIQTTPEKLWKALTTPEFTKQYWFGIDVVSDWKVGSTMKYLKGGDTLVLGEVLAAKPYSLLSYTFHEEKNEESSHEPPTKVILEIEPEVGTETVRLVVTHTDFVENSKHFGNISGGWPAVLSGLKTFLETGKSLAFEA